VAILPFQCQTLWELLWVQFYTLEVGTVKSFDFVVGTQLADSEYMYFIKIIHSLRYLACL